MEDVTNGFEEIIDDYANNVINGLSFDEVRRSLEKTGYEEKDIRFIVRKVDDQVLAHQTQKPQSQFGTVIIWSGLALMALGFVLTLANMYDLIDLGNGYLNLYGPFIAGMIVYILGKNRKQKEQRQ